MAGRKFGKFAAKLILAEENLVNLLIPLLKIVQYNSIIINFLIISLKV